MNKKQEAEIDHFDSPFCPKDNHSHDCACPAFEEGASKALTDLKLALKAEIQKKIDKKHLQAGKMFAEYKDVAGWRFTYEESILKEILLLIDEVKPVIN